VKCDFCEKEAVGYTSYHSAFYCLEHEKEALEIESKMWEAIDEAREQEDEKK
jgi:hypothetical protein